MEYIKVHYCSNPLKHLLKVKLNVNISRIKRMLPFKTSSFYRVEPRRDFVVRKTHTWKECQTIPKAIKFYDIQPKIESINVKVR